MKLYGQTKYCPGCGQSRQGLREEYITENKYIFIKCNCGYGWLEKAKDNKEA